MEKLINKRKLNNEKIDTFDILRWSKQILQGIDFLHRNKIIHRDLRASNIFINGKSLVLGHLGLAKSTRELKSSQNYFANLSYASPEVINRENHSFKTDIW